jgi:hypothetical protein
MSKAICDMLSDHYSISIFKNFSVFFWDKNFSWRNKYKDETPYQEKFFGSTTFLVWLTDGWHLFDFIRIVSSLLAIVFYVPYFDYFLADLAILWVVYFLAFSFFYDYILLIK